MNKNSKEKYNMGNSLELTRQIIDCMMNGFGDDEDKYPEENELYAEISQLPGKSAIRSVLQKLCDHINKETNWFEEINTRLRDYSEGEIWSLGDELLCKTEDAANTLADLLEQLYRSQGEEIIVNTGFYDPDEDKRNNEEDRCTGWWYVNIG